MRRAVAQMKAAGLAQALIVALETGYCRFDMIADVIVVIGEPVPVHIGGADGRFRDSGDD